MRDLALIDALPAADGSQLTPTTRAALDAACNALPFSSGDGIAGPMEMYEGGLIGVVFSLLSDQRGTLAPALCALLVTAFQEHGYDVPPDASDADLLAVIDAVTASDPWHGPAYLKCTAYGIALALQANQPEVALTLADGPEGAGIGWDLMRQTLGAGDRGLS